MNNKGKSPTILRAQRLKEQRREQQTPHQSSHEIFLLRLWEEKKRKQKRIVEKKKLQNRSRKFDRDEDFFQKIKQKILKLMPSIWSRRIRTRSTKDILLDEVIPESEYQTCHKIKNLQMRIGEIWQVVIGCAEGWQNLKQGDLSGLDLINHERKIVIELKNSFNTDNSSARKHNYKKLKTFAMKHPDYTVIYGVINAQNGKAEDKIVEETIRYMSGTLLLRFIFAPNYNYKRIIQVIKENLKTHMH